MRKYIVVNINEEIHTIEEKPTEVLMDGMLRFEVDDSLIGDIDPCLYRFNKQSKQLVRKAAAEIQEKETQNKLVMYEQDLNNMIDNELKIIALERLKAKYPDIDKYDYLNILLLERDWKHNKIKTNGKV